MLQLRSVCDVADNTGAKRAAIIHVLGEAKRYGEIGDVVKAHIKEAAPDGSVKKRSGRRCGGAHPPRHTACRWLYLALR